MQALPLDDRWIHFLACLARQGREAIGRTRQQRLSFSSGVVVSQASKSLDLHYPWDGAETVRHGIDICCASENVCWA